MNIPKYAKLEHERRFLALEPPDLADVRPRLIEDSYLEGGRLRLRRVTHADGTPTEFKLCKKYGALDAVSEPIVNIYLSEAEYARLAALPGRPVRKRRYTVAWRRRGFGVNVFEGELAGLVLIEAEAESADAARATEFPPWAGLEVTGDLFFTGGSLAGLTRQDLAARLALHRAEAGSTPT
jgi:CYTH domain-containing protein